MRSVALLVLLAGCGEAVAPDGGAPQRLFEAPRFTLVDQRGDQVGSGSLRGRPWVANFVFTRCSTMCPMLSTRMAELRDATRDRSGTPRLVSISVDPEHDRPQVLAEYAARHGADPDRWSFLTGRRDEIWDLSEKGFKLAVGERPEDADEPLLHSGKFVLVDGGGWIRGYYDALTDEGFAALLADLERLTAESSQEGAS